MDPALEFGEGNMEGTWGSGGVAPRKIVRGHTLQTLGKRGKRPFCFITDHLADHLYFIPPEIPLALLCKRQRAVIWESKGPQNVYHEHQLESA